MSRNVEFVVVTVGGGLTLMENVSSEPYFMKDVNK